MASPRPLPKKYEERIATHDGKTYTHNKGTIINHKSGPTVFSQDELVERLMNLVGLSKDEALKVLDAMALAMKNTLLKGEQVRMKGFGIFTPSIKPPARYCHFLTSQGAFIKGSPTEIRMSRPRRIITFRPARDLLRRVNPFYLGKDTIDTSTYDTYTRRKDRPADQPQHLRPEPTRKNCYARKILGLPLS